jgi:hypothetical protein
MKLFRLEGYGRESAESYVGGHLATWPVKRWFIPKKSTVQCVVLRFICNNNTFESS